ncbi:unnamed protein product [Brassica rapa subsp. trilocularis]
MPLEVTVVLRWRLVMDPRCVNVEKRLSHRVMTVPVPFYTTIKGEPLEMPSMSSESKIHHLTRMQTKNWIYLFFT